jgi:hypothetical protein
MSTTPQIVQLAILALLAGMAIPLLVQLFLTARTVKRVSESLDRKLDETRRELHELIAGGRRDGGSADLASALAGAAVPAVIAAVRAYRATPANHAHSNGARQSPQQENAP